MKELLTRQLEETLAEIARVEARLTALQTFRDALAKNQPPEMSGPLLEAEKPPERKPRKKRVSDEQARDFAVARQSFTTPDYMEEFGVARNTALAKLQAMAGRGVIERRGGTTSKSAFWLYVRPTGQTTKRRREPPPEATAATEAAVRGEIVAHTRARGPSGKPGTDRKRSAKGVRVKRQRQGT